MSAQLPRADFSLVFPPDPGWVRTAREAIRTALRTANRTDLTDTALLLTSEAVTNAVNACRRSGCSAPVTLYAEWGPHGTLRVLVSDDAPASPRNAPSPETRPTPRAAGGCSSSAAPPPTGASATTGRAPGKRCGSRSTGPVSEQPRRVRHARGLGTHPSHLGSVGRVCCLARITVTARSPLSIGVWRMVCGTKGRFRSA
ncbi:MULTISPECIES: ATP-binding protein [Streptomyces]|uniref:Anti-sigma regulatory factor (Ser/Thr protein kinase) n=1 Tax=Streptomyces demainii TaxID=588122 RepID=A0ABT9KQ30_9ACTN|nr:MULTISPECIES: ATP-binding protein [Streptomyces]MDP9610525.1 anti-sigma regulatory factor (Ser/Thr protein kinase) [Streptomyces demainii]